MNYKEICKKFNLNNLSGADLIRADLSGADLSGANRWEDQRSEVQ